MQGGARAGSGRETIESSSVFTTTTVDSPLIRSRAATIYLLRLAADVAQKCGPTGMKRETPLRTEWAGLRAYTGLKKKMPRLDAETCYHP